MSFYQNMAATSLRLLTKYGTSISLPRVTGGSVDPITGATVAGTDASVTTTGLLKTYPDSLIDGTRILQGDKVLILSNEQEPLPSDTPTVDGENWTIIRIRTIKPDDSTPVIYMVQVRK